MIKVLFDDIPQSYQPGLFDGDFWQTVAKEWAASHNETIERFRIDRSFLVQGVWYKCEWSDISQQWCIERI